MSDTVSRFYCIVCNFDAHNAQGYGGHIRSGWHKQSVSLLADNNPLLAFVPLAHDLEPAPQPPIVEVVPDQDVELLDVSDHVDDYESMLDWAFEDTDESLVRPDPRIFAHAEDIPQSMLLRMYARKEQSPAVAEYLTKWATYLEQRANDQEHFPFKSEKEARWAAYAMTLPSAKAEELWSNLHIDGLCSDINHMKAVLNRVDKLPQIPIRRFDIRASGQCFSVEFRDSLLCARALFARSQLKGVMRYVPEKKFYKGQRVFDDVFDTNWVFHEVASIPGDGTLVPVILYVDATTVTHHGPTVQAHPIIMTLGNVNKNARHAPEARIIVGYMPVFPKQTPGKIRRKVYHTAMRLVLADLEVVRDSGTWAIDPDGNVRHIYVRGCYIIADSPERHMIALVKNTYCVVCKVPLNARGDLQCMQFEERDYGEAGQLQEDALAGSRAARKTVENELHMHCEKNAFTTMYPRLEQHLTPDVMHKQFLGNVKHLRQWLKTMIEKSVGERRSPAVIAELENRVAEWGRGFEGGRGPRHFLTGKGLKASTLAQTLKIVPYCLGGLGIHKELLIIRVFALFADLCMLFQNTLHNESCMLLIRKTIKKFDSACQQCFRKISKSRLCFLNYHNLSHYPLSIMAFGLPDSTASGEKDHKITKSGFTNYTNHRDDPVANFPCQLLSRLNRLEAMQYAFPQYFSLSDVQDEVSLFPTMHVPSVFRGIPCRRAHAVDDIHHQEREWYSVLEVDPGKRNRQRGEQWLFQAAGFLQAPVTDPQVGHVDLVYGQYYEPYDPRRLRDPYTNSLWLRKDQAVRVVHTKSVFCTAFVSKCFFRPGTYLLNRYMNWPRHTEHFASRDPDIVARDSVDISKLVEHEVESVLRHRYVKGQFEYQISWVDPAFNDDKWYPESGFVDVSKSAVTRAVQRYCLAHNLGDPLERCVKSGDESSSMEDVTSEEEENALQ